MKEFKDEIKEMNIDQIDKEIDRLVNYLIIVNNAQTGYRKTINQLHNEKLRRNANRVIPTTHPATDIY